MKKRPIVQSGEFGSQTVFAVGPRKKQGRSWKQNKRMEMRTRRVWEKSVTERRSPPELKDLSCLFGKTGVVDSQASERKERDRDPSPTASLGSKAAVFS